jgi:hypothetical protein
MSRPGPAGDAKKLLCGHEVDAIDHRRRARGQVLT